MNQPHIGRVFTDKHKYCLNPPPDKIIDRAIQTYK